MSPETWKTVGLPIKMGGFGINWAAEDATGAAVGSMALTLGDVWDRFEERPHFPTQEELEELPIIQRFKQSVGRIRRWLDPHRVQDREKEKERVDEATKDLTVSNLITGVYKHMQKRIN